jgi:hypothetical protein
MGIEQEGSIAFRLRHTDPDWATNNKSYRFNTVEAGPIRAWAQKNPDGTVEFHLTGPLKSEIVLEGKMPRVDPSGLHVVITWSRNDVQLYLNAKPTGITKIPPPNTDKPADA